MNNIFESEMIAYLTHGEMVDEWLPEYINYGAHWGLTDWYPQVERRIAEVLEKVPPTEEWTTGWLGSKKEIASFCLYCPGNNTLVAEASVSDDFDTKGEGVVIIPFTADLSVIKQAISDAWQEAEENQKDNREYIMFTLNSCKCGERDGTWIDTYLLDPTGMQDNPPGDCYMEWGWQNMPDQNLTTSEKLVYEYLEDQVLKWWTSGFSDDEYTPPFPDDDEIIAISEDIDRDWVLKRVD